MRSPFNLAERFKLIKKNKEASEVAEIAALESIRNSKFTQLCTKIRWIFYIQMAISIGSFFFAPFKKTEIVNDYERQTISAKNSVAGYRGFITTFSEEHIRIASIRLKDNHLFKGDTIYVLRNIFYKLEGVKHKSSAWPYFLESKWAFCFLWLFLGGVAISTEKSKRATDIDTRNRLSILLLFVTLLYFII